MDIANNIPLLVLGLIDVIAVGFVVVTLLGAAVRDGRDERTFRRALRR